MAADLPTDAPASFEFLAHDPALDFVNTVDERLGDRVELLSDSTALLRWGIEAGLISRDARIGPGAREQREARSELARAVALREVLTRVLDDHVGGRAAAAGDLAAIARAVADACSAGALVEDPVSQEGGLRWQWDRSALATCRHVVASSGLALLTGPRLARVGRCGGPTCGWFFLDTTKRGNRRWCSMSGCGQEAKSTQRRRTRLRQREPAGG